MDKFVSTMFYNFLKRTAKLTKMEELKVEVKSLQVQLADRDELLNQNKVAAQKTTDFEKLIDELKNCKISQENVILQLKEELQAAQKESDDKKSSISDLTASLNNTRNQIQKCKADRSKWKQKAESLAKEMSKICRNSNESSNDLDNLHAEINSLRKEVSLLKLQKKKAEDDLVESVLVHTRYVEAHLRSDGDAIRAYQKVDELERVLQNLTEYVDAKETQLLSIQEVNRALTEELQKSKHHDV
jgi:chromosome segregation ATPase